MTEISTIALEKNKNNKGCTVCCQSCSISELCLPFSLNHSELDKLDNIIERKKPVHKNEILFKQGDMLGSIYAVRTGTLKSYKITENGEEQITAFHLPGDLVGFSGIFGEQHNHTTSALETAMVCEVPFNDLNFLLGEVPRVRYQVLRLMSKEIKNEQDLVLLSRLNAEEKISAFLLNLSKRFERHGFDPFNFRLSMSRSDIANYLGITIETVSRLLRKFHNDEILEVNNKQIIIKDIEKLKNIKG